jgi:hypothetical protein
MFFVGCAHSIDTVDLDQYSNKTIKIITKDSIKYELGEGWKIDSLHNISGRGSKTVNNSTNRFYGTIQSKCIDQIMVSDESTSIFISIIAFTTLAITFIMNNRH